MAGEAEAGGARLSERKSALRVFSTHHRVIALHYFAISMTAVLLGIVLSALMRLHLAYPNLALPGWGAIKPEDYLSLVTMHGTLMVFFVLTVAPQSAFGNLVLAEQIGSRRMALPRLNAAGAWLMWLALFVTASAFIVPMGAPIGGWSAYAPMSILAQAGPGQGAGMDCWIAGIALFCIASTLGSVNFISTVAQQRCRGMSLMRMPLTVWSWFVSAILLLLVGAVLLAAALLLTADRHAGTHFFLPGGLVVNGHVTPAGGDGSPLLWQHLFWFFGHPEVYIAVLPGMGLASTLISTFARRAVAGYRLMVATTLAIAVLGLIVWGHHMFVSGMSPFAGSAFALISISIALPSAIKVLSWLQTLRTGSRAYWGESPMLYTLGFISFFITGGLTGPVLSQPMLDSYLHNTYFVVAHFHLVMAMAVTFGMFAATHYWFPLFAGRRMSERLARWHFWLTLVCAYVTFFPMHFLGLAGLPRHYAQLGGTHAPFGALQAWQTGITHAAFLLIAVQALFLWNLVRSALRGSPAGEDPWRGLSLEWAPREWWDGARRVSRNPFADSAADVRPQWEE